MYLLVIHLNVTVKFDFCFTSFRCVLITPPYPHRLDIQLLLLQIKGKKGKTKKQKFVYLELLQHNLDIHWQTQVVLFPTLFVAKSFLLKGYYSCSLIDLESAVGSVMIQLDLFSNQSPTPHAPSSWSGFCLP